MRATLRAIFLAAWLAAGVASSGAPAQLLSAEQRERLFALLPPPPPDESPAGLADLETLLQVQAGRTPDEVARAARIVKHTPFQMGAAVFGPGFIEPSLPRTAVLFRAVWEEMHTANEAVKRKWDRSRPSVRDARIIPCISVPANQSYPSGHSIHATVWAALFTAAFPARAADFEAQARETRWARVLGGVHYPSDTQAGRLFGEELALALLASPAVQAGVAEMRAEVTAWQDRAAPEAGLRP